MTDLIYYQNSGLYEFQAEVVAAEPAKNSILLVLNRTAFYPEGGGQPADKGSIDGIPVIDVRKKDGLVYHHLPPEATEIPAIGDSVECSINAEHRLDYMQQHSGQHIISAAMLRAAELQTVSVNQGTEFTSIETPAGEVSMEQIARIEEEANSYIRAGVRIESVWADTGNIENYKLRRPSKHSSNIRIINIPGIDCAACGGMHLDNTSGIGLVKYIYQEKIRGNIRTFWKIGNRAYRDYAEKTEVINSLNEFYSARTFELVGKAAAAADQYTESLYRFNKLEEEHALLYASILVAETDGAVIKILEGKSKSFITYLIKSLASGTGRSPAFIFNRSEGVLTWAVACPSSADFDFKSFKNNLLPIIDGKGGGKPPFWQGIAKNPEGMEQMLNKLREQMLSIK